jgi:DNA-directed RNA polymerase subunit beta'
MQIPASKTVVVDAALKTVDDVEGQYAEGLITKGEKYNKVIDIWAQATEQVAGALLAELQTEVAPDLRKDQVGKGRAAGFNPIFMMVDSGARGSTQQIRQLAGMRGLMAKPSGEIIPTPITANFREGLTVLEYFTSTHGARKGLADTALKTANSGYLTRRLVDVAQDMIISEDDCGTVDGIVVSELVEGGEIIEPLKERILGRVTLDDIKDPDSGDVIVAANTLVDEEIAESIEDMGLGKVRIRSVLTCEAKSGCCAKCYGRDLSRGELVRMGEAVGVVAAQSIGEPGTQLTMRTFHIGGTARVVTTSNHVTRNGGKVTFVGLRTIDNRDGLGVAMNRNGSIEVVSVEHEGKKKIEKKEIYPVVYGATVRARDGETVAKNTVLVEWDSYTNPIVTEAGGRVKFGDIIEGVTVKEEVDSATGLSRKVIIETSDPDVRPRVSIKDDAGRTAGRYLLPAGANIMFAEGDSVAPGDVIAKIPRETTKTKDITGGLPRVAELFEARKPKEQAVISEINGKVVLGGFAKGYRKVMVEGEGGLVKEYLIPKGKPLHVHDGDQVRAGEALMEGSANPHDILAVLGVKELQKYLVSEVQQVYALQGVKINDKHIEIIVRQMLRKVMVDDVGDSEFIVAEQVDRFAFDEENRKVIESGGRPATSRPILLGITRASLSTESFISAASFQETTRVLTEAAIAGKVDKLRGLKENVIMGRLIPAGTGFMHYRTKDEPAPEGSEPEGGLSEPEEPAA